MAMARLHPGQSTVARNRTRFRVVTAGRRWGKTALARTILISAAGGGPRRRVWYIAPTYRMAKQIMWDDLLEALPKSWIRKVHNTELWVRLKNGSIIELKGADKPDTLRGVGLYEVVLDEYQDMKGDTWTKVVRPMLAKDRGRALFIGTPKGYANLYDLHILGQDETAKHWASWQFPTISSPFIPLEEIEQARADMDPKSFRQEFLAAFESMSGRVYYPFDRKLHVGKYPFNPHLPVWVGQDFNVDPMCSVILQPQPNGEVWAVSELYEVNSSTEQICEALEKRYWRVHDKIVIYPDPAGGNRSSARGESDLDIFREKGFKKIKYRAKHPAVVDRINAVNRMLLNAKGEIRLRVDESCKHLIMSLEQTLYRKGTREIDKSLGVEHITDALGYPMELEFPLRKVQTFGYSR